MNLEELSGR